MSGDRSLDDVLDSEDARIDPETGKVQERGMFGGWVDTEERVDSDTGTVQKRGLLGDWVDTDERVDPESGRVQERELGFWSDSDKRIDPDTGEVQKRTALGWEGTGKRVETETGEVQKWGAFGWPPTSQPKKGKKKTKDGSTPVGSGGGGTSSGGDGGSGCFKTAIGVILLFVGVCCLLTALSVTGLDGIDSDISSQTEKIKATQVANETHPTAEGFSVEAEPTVAVEEKVTGTGGEGFQVYVVRSGDTLWDIAEEYYGSGYEWTRIRDANKDVIGYMPDGTQKLIVPGQELVLP